MDERTEFSNQLQSLLTAKQEWYNSTELPKILDQYRMLYTCVTNLYELLTQKSLITPDPYRLDKKISDIVAPDSSSFPENERSLVIGTRFSDYDTMLDFVCTYTRFSIENISLAKIKKLVELNNSFLWNELTPNSPRANTKAMAELLNEAKLNSPMMVVSMINDNLSKSSQALTELNSYLSKLSQFQRELYKGTIRKDLFEHPSFNKEKAFSSPDAELAEIKRLFPEVIGKKPFYTELITEIIMEDQGNDKEKLRAAVLGKLQITETVTKKKKKTVNPKEMLFTALLALGALAPTYKALQFKISENFGLLKEKPKSIFSKLSVVFKKAFNIKPKEVEYTIVVTDPVTKAKNRKVIKENDLLLDMQKKQKIYSDIASKSGEFIKITAASESAILSYVGKQISENQKFYNMFLALDEFFKTTTPAANKGKIKGLMIDLDTMKNTIINVNKKRGEYQSFIEEAEQMRKLGLENE